MLIQLERFNCVRELREFETKMETASVQDLKRLKSQYDTLDQRRREIIRLLH
jgi:hypothetical protein